MRQTSPRAFLLLLATLFSVTVSAASARTSTSPTAEVRYHLGDNAAWADPNFDDSSWTVAPRGLWPLPPFHSEGIVWVRVRVPVPADLAGVASLWLVNPHATAQQIFLDGKLIGQSGRLPSQCSCRPSLSWMLPGSLPRRPLPPSPCDSGTHPHFGILAERTVSLVSSAPPQC